MFANIIVDVPIKEVLKQKTGYTYCVPQHLRANIAIGMRVVVPFGNRKVEGFISALNVECEHDFKKIKNIIEITDDFSILSSELLHLGKWMTERYFTRLSNVWQTMLPSGVKTKEQKIIKVLISKEDLEKMDIKIDAKEIVNHLLFNDTMTLNNLIDMYPDAQEKIKLLVEKKIVSIEARYSKQSKIKTRPYITLIDKFKNEKELYLLLKNANKQLAITLLLLKEQQSNKQGMWLAEINDILGNARSAIQSLLVKKIIKLEQKQVIRYGITNQNNEVDKHKLTIEQNKCLHEIINVFNTKISKTILLHGVTGSGKTEVYIQAIKKIISYDKQVIFLVPEIALTPQMISRFYAWFGLEIAVLHSRLSQGERFDEWNRIRDNKAKVIIGARSAIFAPCSDIGLIIIDEEHESTYRQDEAPRYDAREVAVFRSKWHKCPIILGSATPSIESYYLAQQKKYDLLTLLSRPSDRLLPIMEIIDMRNEKKQDNLGVFSKKLLGEIELALHNKHQIILFVNRRGYSSFVLCRSCGQVKKCRWCSISLTYHKQEDCLKCHYCDHKEVNWTKCEHCGSDNVVLYGLGTEKIEQSFIELFPKAKVMRMDNDTTRTKDAHKKIIEKFTAQDIDVLIGTQMVAKGLDFPNVALVGIVSADIALNLPDFRAAERTFQLITQVGGRAGRHNVKGKVIVQTYNPQHYSIQFATKYDYNGFYEQEINTRKSIGYPPYSKLIYIVFSHSEEKIANHIANEFMKIFSILAKEKTKDVFLIGPGACALNKIKNKFRFGIIIKYASWQTTGKLIHDTMDEMNTVINKSKVVLTIDVNPQYLL